MEKDFLKSLISINSVSGNEEEIIEYLKKFFEKNQIKSEIDYVGNIIVELGSGENCLILSSHVDTVPGIIKVREENGKIYGRGAVDDKGTTAAMILALLKFKNKPLKKRIKYLGIIEEEISLNGMQPFIKDKIKADYAIFGEPTNNRVAIAYKGRLSYKIEILSLEGTKHPANIIDFNNPIVLSFNLWAKIENFFRENYKGKTPFFSVLPNLTEIKTDNSSNMIPDKCTFSIDIRIPPGISIEIIKQDILKIFEKFQKNYEIKINYKILSEILGYRIEKNEHIVKISQASIKSILKKEQKLVRKTGTNFMNVFGTVLGIPTVSIGPGDPKLEHTYEEFIDIQEFKNAILIFEKIIEMYLKY